MIREQPGGVSSSPPQDNGSYSAFSMFSVKNRNQTFTPGMVAHRYHPSTPVAEAGESHVQNPLRQSGVSHRLGVKVDRCYQARKHGRGKRGSSLSLRREPGYGWGVGKQNSREEKLGSVRPGAQQAHPQASYGSLGKQIRYSRSASLTRDSRSPAFSFNNYSLCWV